MVGQTCSLFLSLSSPLSRADRCQPDWYLWVLCGFCFQRVVFCATSTRFQHFGVMLQSSQAWLHQLGTMMAPRCPKMVPRCSKMAPRWPQDDPKMAPRCPKMRPRCLQDSPRCCQDLPSAPKDAPKMAPRWPQDVPRMGPKTI